MNKTISILIVALILSFSLVSAVGNECYSKTNENGIYTFIKETDNTKSVVIHTNGRVLNEKASTYFTWYWNLLKDYSKLIQERNELKARVEYLEANPIIEKVGGGHSTSYITNTEYIQCSECAERPACNFPYTKYKDDGKDSCGCAINPRCIDATQQIEIINARE